MPSVTEVLDNLDESIESCIVKSFFAILAADARILAAGFKDYRLLELPNPDDVPAVAAYTMALSPAIARLEDQPSNTETVRVDCIVAFFVPWEQSETDSPIHGQRLLNLVRKIANESVPIVNSVICDEFDIGEVLTDQFVDVRPLPLVPNRAKRLWTVRAQVTWTTKINPTTGALEP